MTARHSFAVCRLWFFFGVLGLSAFAAQASDKIRYDIPAQSLESALTQFGVQSQRQVMFDPDAVPALTTGGVQGEYAPLQALDLLLSNSGLTYTVDGKDTIIVRKSLPKVSASAGFQLAQANPEARQVPGSPEGASLTGSELDELEEVVVTGTHIRGVPVGASPIQVLTRQDIDRSGLTTTAALIRSLTANFGGGLAVETAQSGVLTQHGGENRGYASSPNLRGLGSDATLLLLNGHRLPIASQGFSADMSVIPLAVIDRIEVLKDGASAIYGSDAVAGVVNIITRRSFDKPQTTLVGSGVSSGDKQDFQGSQVLGHDWNSGSGSISYTYDRQGSLDTSARDFSRTAPQPSVLIPTATAQSVYAAINQQLSPRFSLGGDALWTDKRVRNSAAIDAGGFDAPVRSSADIESFIASLSSKVDLGARWQADISALFATDETVEDIPPSIAAGVVGSHVRNYGKVYSLEPRFDGPVFALSGGLVRAALGGSFRSEAFEQSTFNQSLEFDLDRTITGVYGELFVPFYSVANRRKALERLELTASVRFEDYSDFGSTTNPKFGVLWSPVNGLAFRSTYSTSFRAPQMAELQQGDALDILLLLPDPLSASAESLTIYRIGGNPELEPQTAESFNLGLTFDPAPFSGFHGELTYFDIHFKKRIQQPGEGAVFIQLEPDLYGEFLTRDPSVGQVTELTEGPAFANAFVDENGLPIDFLPDDVALIADARRTNLAALDVNGIDLALRYMPERFGNTLSFSLDGSYLLKYSEVLVPGQPSLIRRNTPYYPASVRLRGGVNWTAGPWSIGGFLNYMGRYTDKRDPLDRKEIGAWPTLDSQIAYTSASETSFWAGTSVSLTVINVLDRDPPLVANANPSFTTACCQNYDATNASPLGRYVSLRLGKSW